MMNIYVGLDIDDTAYHGCALNKDDGEMVEFKSRPTLKGLLNQLTKIQRYFPKSQLKLCYEASYIAFSLQRDLSNNSYECDVVSPTNMANLRNKPIKTDRLDAIQLANNFALGILTVVNVPEIEMEHDRDLIRTRQNIVKQRNDSRRHLHSLLRRYGMHYKTESKNASYWTRNHYCWLDKVVEEAAGSFRINLQLLLRQLKDTDRTIADYNTQIEELAKSERYRRQVDALVCYKGIKNTFALMMITEIGDIKRFPHPCKLVAWSGMDIREYSSGGKKNRFGITKHGNKYLRTAFVEANQKAYKSVRITKDLKARRKNTDPEFIKIADRCLSRINKKGNRLLAAGKHSNVVKVACAREMIGFVWESLNQAAA